MMRNESWPFKTIFIFVLAAYSGLAGIAFMTDLFPLFLGLMGVILYFAFVIGFPERALIAVIIVSIILPEEFAIRISGLPRIGPTRILIALFLVGYAARFLLNKSREPIRRSYPLIVPIAIFLLTAFVSSLFSIDMTKSFYSLLSYTFGQFILFYVIYRSLHIPTFWESFKKALFLITAFVCLIAIFEEIARVNPLLALYPNESIVFREGILRARATFFHPIALGCYLTLIAPFAILDIIEKRKKAARVALLSLIVTALFLTVSRGPWLAFLFETSGLSFWYLKKNRYAALSASALILAMIIMIGGIFIGNQGNQKASHNLINPSGIKPGYLDERSSEYYRIALMKAIFKSLKGYRSIIGYGPGTFHLANVESRYAGDEHTLTAADSHFLKVLFEQGILGLLSFLFLIVASVAAAIVAIKHSERSHKPLAVVSLLVICAFIFENISVSMFTLLPLGLLFWVSVGVSLDINDQYRSGNSAV